MTVCKMYGKSLFILQSTRKEGLGLKACCQIFFLCCKALPYIFRKKLSKFLDIMYLCWFSSSAKHVALLLLMFSWKAFVLYAPYLFPFFLSLKPKRGFQIFAMLTLLFEPFWYYKLHFMTLANKGQELLKKSSIPHRKWNIKISKKSFQCEQKITEKKNEKGKKVSFLSTIRYSNVHLTRVINYMGLEFLYHKRKKQAG